MNKIINCLIATFFVHSIHAKPFDELSLQNSNEPPLIDIPLVTFDGSESTTFKFHELNDPVMVSHDVRYLGILTVGMF